MSAPSDILTMGRMSPSASPSRGESIRRSSYAYRSTSDYMSRGGMGGTAGLAVSGGSAAVASYGAAPVERVSGRGSAAPSRYGRRPVQLVGGSRGSYGRTAFDVESGHVSDRSSRPRRVASAYAGSGRSASERAAFGREDSGRSSYARMGSERVSSGRTSFGRPDSERDGLGSGSSSRGASARVTASGFSGGATAAVIGSVRDGVAAATIGAVRGAASGWIGSTRNSGERDGARERGFADRAASRDRGVSHERAAAKASPVAVAAEWVGAHRILSAAIVVTLVLVLMLYPPARAYYGAVRTNGVLSSQLSDINASNSTMQSQVDSLMTREGIEDEARRRGYVSEGDTPVDMSGVDDTGCPSADTTVTQPSSSASNPDNPWYIGVLDALFRYDPSSQGLS